MSHDTDKLIRQLSLVAFLMAERRLLTARDVKSNVEGYSEMSDEAFARPDRALFQDIRRYFPITAQARVAWSVREGVGAAIAFIEQQIEAGAFDGGIARCKATTRKGKACQRTPLPNRDYCPSHQHLEARTSLAA